MCTDRGWGTRAGLDAAAWGCVSRARTRCHVMGTSPWAWHTGLSLQCDPKHVHQYCISYTRPPRPYQASTLCIPCRVGNTEQKKGRSCRAGSCVLEWDWTVICPPSGHLWGSPQHMNAMVECCLWTERQHLPYCSASLTGKEWLWVPSSQAFSCTAHSSLGSCFARWELDTTVLGAKATKAQHRESKVCAECLLPNQQAVCQIAAGACLNMQSARYPHLICLR